MAVGRRLAVSMVAMEANERQGKPYPYASWREVDEMKNSRRIKQEAERGSIVQILVEWQMEWMPVGELRLHWLRRAGYPLSEDEMQFHLNYLAEKGYVETKHLRAVRAGLELTAVRATAKGVDLAEGRIAEHAGVGL